MPIYEYRCLGCGANTEKMQKVSDAPLEKCDACGGKLEKQISLSGFQFKGAGWYVTDYAAKKGATETTAKTEKSDAGEKTEKTSAAESTAAADGASKKSNDATAATVSKTDAPAKKD